MGECDKGECAEMRKVFRGCCKEPELCYDEREKRSDECITYGRWRIHPETNGTFSDVHLLLNASGCSGHSTVEIQGGLWVFERCDIRSMRGICLYAGREDMFMQSLYDCGRANGGLGPEGRLRVEANNPEHNWRYEEHLSDETKDSDEEGKKLFRFVFVSVRACVHTLGWQGCQGQVKVVVDDPEAD